jgi:methylenetetrahydrofolate dehydrogenase (NADP+) / methenyltetrahydrofolate cyclohydrolase
MAELIKGSLVASHIRQQVRKEAAALTAAGVRPCLAVCLVGEDSGSRIYVRRKQQACAAVGIESRRAELPFTVTTDQVLEVVQRWNADGSVHGILIQLPLPDQVDRFTVLNAIDPAKDVDGIQATNIGDLAQGRPRFLPCTPGGIIELFKHYNITTRGKHVVIVNRGIVVGEPLALMLVQDGRFGNATVTVCHEHTRNIERICRMADIIVVAVGKRPEFALRGDMVKRGAIVIDVGINRAGKRIIGDVDFDEVYERASMITPVPGGVGPCTVAMLLRNTVEAARLAAIARPAARAARDGEPGAREALRLVPADG